jgi:hypothetical protein
VVRHQPHSCDGFGPGLPHVTRSALVSLAWPGGGRPTIPDVDDTDTDEAFDFPADLLQLQREPDEVRRELARGRRPSPAWVVTSK